MTDTRKTLEEKRDKALAEGNTEKARVMQVLIDGLEDHKPAPVVEWKDKTRWIIKTF